MPHPKVQLIVLRVAGRSLCCCCNIHCSLYGFSLSLHSGEITTWALLTNTQQICNLHSMDKSWPAVVHGPC